MNSKLKGWIIAGVVILILALPIIIDAVRRGSIDVISFDEFVELVNESEFALVYFGDTEADGFEDIQESLVLLKDDFEVDIYAVNIEVLSPIERDELLDLFEGDVAYIILKEGDVVHVEEGSTTLNRLRTLLDRHLNYVIPTDEVAYIVPETAEEFLEAISGRRNIVMSVIGIDTCPFCVRYAPIFNDIAQEFELDIFYINGTRMDREEYEEILNTLIMPAGCTTDVTEETPLSGISGVPFTIFTNNGRITHCFPGVVSRERLIQELQDVGVIQE